MIPVLNIMVLTVTFLTAAVEAVDMVSVVPVNVFHHVYGKL